MADADTARLCVQIVHSHFGPLTSVSALLDFAMILISIDTRQAIVSTLLARGRLSLQQLVRYSTLKSRTVRAAILVLVQHNILWHAQSDDEGEVFEVNIEECLMRLRFGRYVWQAEQLFGSAVSYMSDSSSTVDETLVPRARTLSKSFWTMENFGHQILCLTYRSMIRKVSFT